MEPAPDEVKCPRCNSNGGAYWGEEFAAVGIEEGEYVCLAGQCFHRWAVNTDLNEWREYDQTQPKLEVL